MREEIITEFCKSETKLRLIIVSTAFGLGLDCKDIVWVFNCGTPNTLEELVQEAGRNGNQAHTILYHKAIGNDVTEQAKFMEKTSVFATGNCFLRTFFSFTKRVVLVDVNVVICVLYGVLVKIVVFCK